MTTLLLASQSPRRKELLQNLGFDFETVSISCEEIYPADLPASEVAAYLSELKAGAFQPKPNEILITADTVVILNDKILGKPKDSEDALEMILSLSGKAHQVCTAVTIKTTESTETFSDFADVIFDEISPSEAEFYVENFHPTDKAGSYGIQEWLGMAKINSIRGSFYTIMGFPTHIIYRELKKRGVLVLN